jgi:hypothetical protein
LRGIARLDAPDAFPLAGIDASAELATCSQFALDLSVPAGETVAVDEGRPQFVDPRLEVFFVVCYSGSRFARIGARSGGEVPTVLAL